MTAGVGLSAMFQGRSLRLEKCSWSVSVQVACGFHIGYWDDAHTECSRLSYMLPTRRWGGVSGCGKWVGVPVRVAFLDSPVATGYGLSITA